MTRRSATRAAFLSLAATLALGPCACGPTSRAGAPAAAGAPGAPPALVQAKCGSCHRTPAPHPLKDGEALRRLHIQRLRLTPEESAEAFDWVQGGGGSPQGLPGAVSGSGQNR